MIKLDNKDKQILYELDRNSRQTDKEIGKKVGLARNSIAYRIERLINKKVITKFITLINPVKFNKSIFKLYLRVDGTTDSLKQYLLKEKDVFWVTKCEGSWNLIIAIWTFSTYELYKFIQRLITKFGSQINAKEISSQIEVPFFNRAYLTNTKGSVKCFWGGELKKVKIDGLDIQILKLLSTNSRINSVKMAQLLNSSARIIRYRIKLMEKKGIILSYSIQLNVASFGFDYYKTIIQFKQGNMLEEKKLIEYCKNQGNILYYIKSLGAWDLELEWEISEYKELVRKFDEMRNKFPNLIKGAEHLLITEEYKGEYNTIS